MGDVNPIDVLLENLDDLTLDKVVMAAGEMSKEERLERVEILRRQRALWVSKEKR